MSKTIFSQIMDFIPKYKFDKCVERYGGNYRTRNFKCPDKSGFLCMSFAQLSYRESLLVWAPEPEGILVLV